MKIKLHHWFKKIIIIFFLAFLFLNISLLVQANETKTKSDTKPKSDNKNVLILGRLPGDKIDVYNVFLDILNQAFKTKNLDYVVVLSKEPMTPKRLIIESEKNSISDKKIDFLIWTQDSPFLKDLQKINIPILENLSSFYLPVVKKGSSKNLNPYIEKKDFSGITASFGYPLKNLGSSSFESLKQIGFTLMDASSPEAGVQMLIANRFDILLLDHRLADDFLEQFKNEVEIDKNFVIKTFSYNHFFVPRTKKHTEIKSILESALKEMKKNKSLEQIYKKYHLQENLNKYIQNKIIIETKETNNTNSNN